MSNNTRAETNPDLYSLQAENLDRKCVPVESQPKDRHYAMSIQFTGDVSIRSLDSTLKDFGFSEVPVAQKALTLRVKQVLPFIPDKRLLRDYAAVLQDSYNASNQNVTLRNLTFTGYDYLYYVKQDSESSPQQNLAPDKIE